MVADRFEMSPFCAGLGMRLLRAGGGEAEVAMTLGPEHANRSGYAHGGITCSLIDTACGIASTVGHDGSLEARVVTLQLTIGYLRPLPLEGEIRAVARVVGGGKTMVFCEATVVDDKGRVAANGQGCFRRTVRGTASG